MKKFILYSILAAAFVFTIATSSVSAGTIQKFLVGDWDVTYDWGCDGTKSTAVWFLASDGTFTSSQDLSGTWEQHRRTVELNYSTGCMPTYTGTLESLKSMSGTMKCTDGSENSGCFTAIEKATSAEVVDAQEQGGEDSP